MKSFLKSILHNVAEAAKDTAMGMIPGSDLVIKGITILLDKNDDNNVEGLQLLEDGIMSAINSLVPSKVSNAALVSEGLVKLKEAFDLIKQGFKK